MQGEMTMSEIKEGFARLNIEDSNVPLLIEFIEEYGKCPACGMPLTIKDDVNGGT